MEDKGYICLSPKRIEDEDKVALFVICNDDKYIEQCISFLKTQSCKEVNLYFILSSKCNCTDNQISDWLILEDNKNSEYEENSFFSKILQARSEEKTEEEVQKDFDQDCVEREQFEKINIIREPSQHIELSFINKFASNMKEKYIAILDSYDVFHSDDSLEIIVNNAKRMKGICLIAQGYDCNYNLDVKNTAIHFNFEKALIASKNKAISQILLSLYPIRFFAVYKKSFFTKFGGFDEDLSEIFGLSVILKVLSSNETYTYLKEPVVRFRENGFSNNYMIFNKKNYHNYIIDTQRTIEKYILAENKSKYIKYIANFALGRLVYWGEMGLVSKGIFALKYSPVIISRKVSKYIKTVWLTKFSLLEYLLFSIVCILAGTSILFCKIHPLTGACCIFLGVSAFIFCVIYLFYWLWEGTYLRRDINGNN